MSDATSNPGGIKLEEELDFTSDFKAPSYEEWKQQVEKDLKGASFEKKLITKTYEGISLQPIYTKDDLKDLAFVKSLPGSDDFVRAANAGGYVSKTWDICQEIPYCDAKEFNEALKNDLERGQTAINVPLDAATKAGLDADYAEADLVGKGGLSVSAFKSLTRAFDGIDLTKYPLHVSSGYSAASILMVFAAFFKKNEIDASKISGSITADPIGYLAEKGKIPISEEAAFNSLKITLEWAKENAPNIKTTSVSGLPYANAGASSVEELAYVLATAVEYLNELIERGVSINDAAASIRFTFNVGPNYFMEIAKLRAARILWSKIVAEFGGSTEAQKMTIHARTSTYNQTKLDPYVNMLRTTTEAFSAVIGGVDSLHTNPFDETFGTPDTFSRRISRNTQIILKEESHLDELIDPAGGSFYVEKLTDEVCKAVWTLFQSVEANGGMLASLKNGSVKTKIEETVGARVADFSKRKSVIVGSNMYANMKENKIADKELDNEALKLKRSDYLQQYRVSGNADKNQSVIEKLQELTNPLSAEFVTIGAEAIMDGATLGEVSNSLRSYIDGSVSVAPLKVHRAAEMFEELRAKAESINEKTGSLPKLFLANMGALKNHKGRADFSRGFFEVGGFDVIYPNGFDTPEDAAKAALESGAKAVVICSTDDNYPEVVPGVVKGIKDQDPSVTVILAGYPKDQIEAHKASGVDEFIFLGANVYSICLNLLNKVGGEG